MTPLLNKPTIPVNAWLVNEWGIYRKPLTCSSERLVIYHRAACMFSLDSRRRSQGFVTSISKEPVNRIARDFVCEYLKYLTDRALISTTVSILCFY